MTSQKGKIKVSFLGEASSTVTGSMVLIETSSKKILLECGLYQSCKDTIENYRVNNQKFPFKASQIDYVFLPHNHSDHGGRMPLLFRRGGRPRIIATNRTIGLERILLEDSARIMQSDAIELRKKRGKDYQPIYTQEDVDTCLSHYEEYPIGETIQLDECIKFRFVPSGHIINSAQLILWIKEGNITKKVVYTSDLGNTHTEKYYTNRFSAEKKCDLFIGETTYAGNPRIASAKTRKRDLERLQTDIFSTCVLNSARITIPVFAMDRCQNMLTHIYKIMASDPLLNNIPVYVDSPMAMRMCQEYRKILDGDALKQWEEVLLWKNLKFIESSEESRSIRASGIPCVVLSSSGMIIARGRSAGWAADMLPHVNDRIVFCGYSAEGSIGAIIKEGKQKTITISGKRCRNRCQVTNLTSFTSHMQSDSLLDYYGKVDAQKIVLVHGEMEGKKRFAAELQERLSANNLSTQPVVCQKGTSMWI